MNCGCCNTTHTQGGGITAKSPSFSLWAPGLAGFYPCRSISIKALLASQALRIKTWTPSLPTHGTYQYLSIKSHKFLYIRSLTFTPSLLFLWWPSEFRSLYFFAGSIRTSVLISTKLVVCVSTREPIITFSSDHIIPLLKNHQRLLLLNFIILAFKLTHNLIPTYHVYFVPSQYLHSTQNELLTISLIFSVLLFISSLIQKMQLPTLQAAATCRPAPPSPRWQPLCLTQLSLTLNSVHSMWYLQVHFKVLKKQILLSSSIHLCPQKLVFPRVLSPSCMLL